MLFLNRVNRLRCQRIGSYIFTKWFSFLVIVTERPQILRFVHKKTFIKVLIVNVFQTQNNVKNKKKRFYISLMTLISEI